jgi:hypothetical protein
MDIAYAFLALSSGGALACALSRVDPLLDRVQDFVEHWREKFKGVPDLIEG